MTQSHEFVDKVYPLTGRLASAQLGEKLVPYVANDRRQLAERSADGTVPARAIERRYYDTDAVRHALVEATNQNLLYYDEVDGIVYPPMKSARQERIRYM
jgi:hypothetical protein